MSFFNDAVVEAMRTGNYICSKCGAKMEFENELEITLVCPKCGHSIDFDRYGFENDEDYEALYPTKEDVCGYDDEDEDDDEDDSGETYDEVYNELDND